MTTTLAAPTQKLVQRLLVSSRAPRLRTYAEFAEQEIVLPNGPFTGRKIKRHMQPATFVWFDELDRNRWRRHVYIAPVQSGKTLSALVIPLMHTLFERQETAILGAPKLEIAHDKWREDFLPVIEKSRYAVYLPRTGRGSRGGIPQDHIKFRNGVTMKFMSGQGSDDSRSAFTARWVFITETDKMDVAGDVSRESDPVSQIEDRMMAFDRIGGGRSFLECTASIPEGKIWSEYQRSSQGRLAIPCPKCRVYVSPGREHFVGWNGAENEDAAGAAGHFECPECGAAWAEQDRIDANQSAVLVHEGQELTESGEVVGPIPSVRTLGFRVSAANNSFVSDRTISIQEWLGSQCEPESEEQQNVEKTLLQKVWALPWEPPDLDDMKLDVSSVTRKSSLLPKGILPADTQWLTIGIDLRQTKGHWVCLAWREDRTVHCPEYGEFDIDSKNLGVEVATLQALHDFREHVVEHGWEVEGTGTRRIPEAVWVDAGWKNKAVYQFCIESGGVRYLPIYGRGQSQYNSKTYTRPKTTTKLVRELGHHYHIEWWGKDGTHVVLVNADEWKTFLHSRISTPADKPGSLTLFHDRGDRNTHRAIGRHWTAERMTWEVKPGKGEVRVWVTESRVNHWFDAGYIACAAGHFCGFEVTGQEVAVASPDVPPQDSGFSTPGGQAFVATER